jgi:hypothetical protein
MDTKFNIDPNPSTMVDLIRFGFMSKIALPKLMHPTMAII